MRPGVTGNDGPVMGDAAGAAAAAATAAALLTCRLETVAVWAATGATLTGCPVNELSKTPALAIHLLYGTGAVDGCAEVVFVSCNVFISQISI